MAENIWGEEIDLKLEEAFINSHTLSTQGSWKRLQAIIDSCRVCGAKHVLYEEDCTVNIIWEEDNGLHVYGKDGYNNYKILEFREVMNWHQVVSLAHHTTVHYHFYILETSEGTVLLNIKTLKFTLVHYKKIIPTDMSFHREFYLSERDNDYYCNYLEFLWVDNTLYDENLNKRLSLSNHFVILDTTDYFVVADDGFLIRVFYINLNCYKGDTIEEISYHCRRSATSNAVFLQFDSIGLSPIYCSFDVISKKFVANKSFIKEEQSKFRLPADHYGLMDALDGEPDAYWNID